MAWKGATRDGGNGQFERRCGDKRHRGARWLPLSLVHFHAANEGGFLHRCRVCHQRNARDQWRANHPDSKRQASPRRQKRAACELDRLTSTWGRAA